MQVADSSIRLHVVQRPSAFRAEVQRDIVRLIASPFQVTANCSVTGAPISLPPSALTNPRNSPWKLGFMQLQVLEVQWAYYRGLQSSDGCLLNDYASGRSLDLCRDYNRMSGTPWYEGSSNPVDCYGIPDTSKPAPWNLEFYFGDNPLNEFPAAVLNPDTQRRNYFHEARVAMAFITTLTCQSPTGLTHLRNFSWSVIWHVRSTTDTPQLSNARFTLLPGSGFWISHFRKGPPTTSKYTALLNNLSLTKSCNEIANSAAVNKQVSGWWQTFPLMKEKDKLF
jgi:hypothetical protein